MVAGIIDYWSAHQKTREGHGDSVTVVAFSPDGKTLALASGDRTIWLWDAALGTHQQTLEGHVNSVNAVAFSPDGKTLASASDDGTIRLWDAATGAHRKTPEEHGDWVKAVAFLPDTQYLETKQGSLSINLNPNLNLDALYTSKDGQSAASGTYFVSEWIARDRKNLLWLPPSYRATCVAVYDNILVLGHATGQITFLCF